MTSGGNNLIDFSENQLTKFRAVYTVKVDRGPKVCRQSFMQDSVKENLKSQILKGSVDPQPHFPPQNDVPETTTTGKKSCGPAKLQNDDKTKSRASWFVCLSCSASYLSHMSAALKLTILALMARCNSTVCPFNRKAESDIVSVSRWTW